MAQLHPTCKKLSQVEKQDTAKEQFLLNCSLANVYVWAAAIIYRDEAVGSFGIYGLWKHQTQTLELCNVLASNSEMGICVAPSIEISLDSNT